MRFSIITLGCKVNQYESEALEQFLEDMGHIPCDSRWIIGKRLPESKTSDVCIVNTCAVTKKAAMQSRQVVRQAIRSNPGALIVVTGCYAQIRPNEILEISGVHAVVGHCKKGDLFNYIRALMENKNSTPIVAVQNVHVTEFFQDMPVTPSGSRTRPFLKIQDGCNSFCTYCIVPYARGKSRSLPFQQVLEKVRELKNKGFHEIVLTGIHLGAYGQDLSPGTTLYDLLMRIRELSLIHRVRLSSIEPVELNNNIIDLSAEWQGLCPHFHIPLQSGDNSILKKMNRPYQREYFQDLVLNIREKVPHAAIGVDCLLGFPGETSDAFGNTYDLIRKLPVAYLHVFPFSPREGTPAWGYPGKISPREIKIRTRNMRLLGAEKKKHFYENFIGKRLEVVVEKRCNQDPGLLKTMSSNYIPVFIDGPDEVKNTIQSVTVTRISEDSMVLGLLTNKEVKE